MPRKPLSRIWRSVVVFLVVGLLISGALFFADARLLSLFAFLGTLIGTAIYLLGDSSSLPGTAGDHDKDVPT